MGNGAPHHGFCWGTKHRRTPHSGATKECNDIHNTRWAVGMRRRRPCCTTKLDNHFFLEEWFDCRINCPLFLGVIAVAFVHRRPKSYSVAATSSKKMVVHVSTAPSLAPTTPTPTPGNHEWMQRSTSTTSDFLQC